MMFRLFGLLDSATPAEAMALAPRTGSRAPAGDALLAGGVLPAQRSDLQDPERSGIEEKSDSETADFLARFYLNQQC